MVERGESPARSVHICCHVCIYGESCGDFISSLLLRWLVLMALLVCRYGESCGNFIPSLLLLLAGIDGFMP